MEISKDLSDLTQSSNLDPNAGRTPSGPTNPVLDPHPNAKDDPSARLLSPDADEPKINIESDIPSDGRDVVGEAMIRDLPQRPELTKPASQPDPFKQAT